MFRWLLPALCAILVCLFASNIAGESPGPSITVTPRKSKSIAVGQPSSTFLRTDVRVVLVPVSVTDEMNRPVNGLTRDRFRVLEDGVEQKITSFVWEDGPVSL